MSAPIHKQRETTRHTANRRCHPEPALRAKVKMRPASSSRATNWSEARSLRSGRL